MEQNSEFVKRIYNELLERDPEKRGYEFWLSQLDQKQKTRDEIIDSIKLSDEYHNKKMAEKGTYEVVPGISFRVEKQSDVAVIKSIFLKNEYQHEYFKIQDNDTVLDIGAHIGSFTIWATKKASNVSVIAFEPHTRNFQLLEENISLNNISTIKCFKKAVYGNKSKRILHNPRPEINHTTGFTLIREGKEVEKVDCVTIKEINESNLVNVIKMDVEGSEFSIFHTLTSDDIKNVRCIA